MVVNRTVADAGPGLKGWKKTVTFVFPDGETLMLLVDTENTEDPMTETDEVRFAVPVLETANVALSMCPTVVCRAADAGDITILALFAI